VARQLTFAHRHTLGTVLALVLALIPLALAPAASAADEPPRFRVTDLGALHDGPATAWDMNAGGQVLGLWFDRGDLARTYLTPGPGPINPAAHDLGDLPGNGNTLRPAALDDAGNAVVMANTPGASDIYGRRSYYIPAGRTAADAVPIPTLGGEFGFTEGMNNRGQVVGWSRPVGAGSTPWHATLWSQATGTRDLGTLAGGYSRADDINDLGQVVGWSDAVGNNPRAFRTAPNAAIAPGDDIGTLGGTYAAAHVINNLGQAAGMSSVAGSTAVHLFRTSPNADINPATDDLGLLPDTVLVNAYDMNDRGDIVGEALLAEGGFRAFLARGNDLYNLNDLAVGLPPGLILYGATAISETGDTILVTGSGPDNRWRALLLTPVPEPTGAWACVLAMGTQLRRTRRRGTTG
jgi:probable HAF family extracellular repeat protein